MPILPAEPPGRSLPLGRAAKRFTMDFSLLSTTHPLPTLHPESESESAAEEASAAEQPPGAEANNLEDVLIQVFCLKPPPRHHHTLLGIVKSSANYC